MTAADQPPAAGPAPVDEGVRRQAERRMLEGLVCPVTQSTLDYDRERQELISRKARLAYPIREGIPVMLVAEARQIGD